MAKKSETDKTTETEEAAAATAAAEEAKSTGATGNTEHEQDGDGSDETVITDDTFADIASLMDPDDADEDFGAILPKTVKGVKEATKEEVAKGGEGKAEGKEAATTDGEAATVPPASTEQQTTEAAAAEPPTQQEQPPSETVPQGPTEEELRQQQMERLTTFRDQLAEKYSLSEETAEAFVSEPEKVVPTLLANLHVNLLADLTQRMVTAVPMIVQHTTTQRESQTNAVDKFFSQWPGLKEHAQSVAEIGARWRNANPDAPVEAYINEVGALAALALKRDPRELMDQQQAAAVKPAATPAPKPHVPPAPGGVAEQPKTKTTVNPFAAVAMFEEELDDDA